MTGWLFQSTRPAALAVPGCGVATTIAGVFVAAGIGVSVGALAAWLGMVARGGVAVHRGWLFVAAVDGTPEHAASSRPGTKQISARVVG